MPIFLTRSLLVCALLTVGGCQTRRVAPLCEGQFERWEDEAESAQVALLPWVTPVGLPDAPLPERRPAAAILTPVPKKSRDSEPVKPALRPGDVEKEAIRASVLLDPFDREAWGRWARHKLRETQLQMLEASVDPIKHDSARTLSKLADQVVFFHGSSESGNVVRMLRDLKRIAEATRRARAAVCPEG